MGIPVILTALKMKSQDLNIAELIDFEAGSVALKGRRLLIHDLWALGQFRKDLIETIGEEMARRILTRKGLFWGQADAAGMQRLYNWDSIEEWIKSASVLAQISGKAQVAMNVVSIVKPQGTVEIELTCMNSAEVSQHQDQFGIASRPVCWVTLGYLSGYVSYCVGKSVYFKELRCQAMGADSCAMIGKDIDSWGAEIEGELTYFRTANMQKEVQELTHRIREQQRKLNSQRMRLRAVRQIGTISDTEVRSKSFRNVLVLAEKAAAFDTTVLITGETGTGKEVLARHIHALSPRKNGPFVPINCSAFPDALLESELFGHRAGSFTGATENKPGLIKSAEGGIVFLDEIGDMPLELQSKLLRTLQSKEVRPVGGTVTDKVDIRVISATNIDLSFLVEEKKFRKDLFYRLQVIHIKLPPLRDRVEDILPLARHFIETFKKRHKIKNLRFSPVMIDILVRYQWPGNIRELENILEQAAVLCHDGLITPDFLPKAIVENRPAQPQDLFQQTLADVEKVHIERVLEFTKGNQTKAARILGIGESTLYRRLKLFST